MNTTVLPHPPYSPDLAPADFILFPKLKSTLKGRQFQTIQEITENSQMELRAVPEKAYQDCFQKWQRRWERCISAGEEYFEGDKQGLDFDDMSSFFPCILCDARKYINPGDELLVTEM
jgi:hypothetical protein